MSDNKEYTFAERIIKLIPLFSGILISFGIGKLYLKYWFYNIDILEYISVGEALLVSISEILSVFLVLIFSSLTADYLNVFDIKNTNDKLAEIENNLTKETVAKTKVELEIINKNLFDIGKTLSRLTTAIFVSAIIFCSAKSLYLFIRFIQTKEIYFQNFSFLYFILAGSTLILFFMKIYYLNKLKNDKNYNSTFFSFYIPLFFVTTFICVNVYSKENENKYGLIKHPDNKILLQNNKVLELNSHTFQVGRTNNYTILYNKKEGNTLIISNNEIKSYTINNNKKE